MIRNVLLSGGVAHDFPTTSRLLAETLTEVGVESQVVDDPNQAVAAIGAADLVTVNMLRWRMLDGRYAAQRERWGLSLGEPVRAALRDHVHRGGGLLAVHGATICFDDWPEWRGLVGAVWNWQRSSHPPVGPARIGVRGDHPIVAGLTDFDTDDEVYGFLDLEPDVEPLLTGRHSGAEHPLAWARQVGAGRVVYDALGHHAPSYRTAEHRRVLRRAALWALSRPDREVSRA